METFTALKLVHHVGTLLLFGSALAVAIWTWRVRRSGDTAVYARNLQRPWLFVWLLMGLGLLSLPISGWWLVHMAGWSLGQTWLLGAALLYLLGCVIWLLLLGRLNRLRVAAGEGGTTPRTALILAVLGAGVFLGILALMVVKPV
ncbi:DUF2269 domain-containing protein [Pseudomonas sp. LS1212]|uniref:DUF2269 domain-containing protein n=1 Tax=Pseudomonas sp. LS1212 TaxID=2972478 RepID=UPI00215BF69E|nr:DUF2269 domain-containing protein [Pseudomonas sp. LS1212]UVJ43830.1 DUF2269 domain-containing protein [Pseudomonas sp. LS1212]